MKIKKNTFVTLEYILNDEEGNLVDSTKDNRPLCFIQGVGQIIIGLENALEGRVKGEKFQVIIKPVEAYGERREDMVQEVDRDQFDFPDDIKIGDQFQTYTESGYLVLTIINVIDDRVTVDANHPLAGKNLHFDIEVIDVRAASEDELNTVQEGCSGCQHCDDSDHEDCGNCGSGCGGDGGVCQ